MTNHYKSIPQIANVIAVATGVGIGKFANDWLVSQKTDRVFALFAVIVVVIFCSRILSFLIEAFFGRAGWLRRLILGRYYVEGTWIDFTYYDFETSSEISHNRSSEISHNRLEQEGYSLRFQGETYDEEGRLLGTFKSELLEIDWPMLRFTYREEPVGGDAPSFQGYGQLQFTERKQHPVSYSGYGFRFDKGGRSGFVGIRVDDPEELRSLEIIGTRVSTLAKRASEMSALSS